MQNWFFDQINIDNITVDFDSTVITRYGDQQGSAKGYNPNKRGRNSHHPLMAFVSQTRMVANAWLRPGNTADSSNCKEFMKETFHQALQGKKVGFIKKKSEKLRCFLANFLALKENAFWNLWNFGKFGGLKNEAPST